MDHPAYEGVDRNVMLTAMNRIISIRREFGSERREPGHRREQ